MIDVSGEFVDRTVDALLVMCGQCNMDLELFNRGPMEEWIMQGFESKVDILSLVGLTEENDFRICRGAGDGMTESELRSEKPRLTRFLALVWGDDGFSLTDMRGPKGAKLTRALLKEIAGYGLADNVYDWETDKKYSIWALFEALLESNIRRVSDIGPRLGEALNNRGHVVVSGNPLDFAGASHRADFESCYRPRRHTYDDTNYFNATLALWANSPGTLVAYTTETMPSPFVVPRKPGRMWIYADLGLETGTPYFIQGRVFGTIGEVAQKVARETVLKPLREFHGVDREKQWRKSTKSGSGACYSGDFPGYNGDCGQWVVWYLPQLEPHVHWCWDAGRAVCWGCGSENGHDKGGLCETCAEEYDYHCLECGDGVDEDDARFYGGNAYCERCYSNNFGVCDICGDDFHRDDLNSIGISYVCDDCLSENYVECRVCGDYVYNDDASFYDAMDYANLRHDIYLCPDCSRGVESVICEYCGGEMLESHYDFHGRPLFDGDDAFCSFSCRDQYVFEQAVEGLTEEEIEGVLIEKGDLIPLESEAA